MTTISQRRARLAHDLESRLHAPQEDRRIFLIDRSEKALTELDKWAALEDAGAVLPPLAGTVLTVKSCFDVAGWVTSCASAATAQDEPATSDAPAVAALRAAGAVVMGQTNMTEFAYGALGINSHFGTPRTPLDPTGERVAGGSTSGGAVAVATGLADLSLGSDTSGSARIPAAFCGCFGFKPSHRRYDRGGMGFLSPTFDVPGLLSSDLATIVSADRVLTGARASAVASCDPRSLRYAVPAHLARIELEGEVRTAFEKFIAALEARGVRIETVELPSLAQSSAISAGGGIISAEAHAVHRDRIAEHFDLYDPLVGDRVRKGADVPAHRYVAALRALADCADQFDLEIDGFDGFLLPTTPILAPVLSELADFETYLAANSRSFSLTEYANRLNLPSITVPLGRLSTGVMLTGTRASDDSVLAQAKILAGIASRPD
jgi:aspartyl-tRNA(Asn)/glutamyl-tRNA(Gln) amidotransferase subunit A